MNTKEALENLCAECNKGEYDENIDYWKEIIEKDLELLEEFEILKNYYPDFKDFLTKMFENGYNTDLKKIKEWLNNDK